MVQNRQKTPPNMQSRVVWFAMSKNPIWPIADPPNPHVADPGFYPIREGGRDFSRCPLVFLFILGLLVDTGRHKSVAGRLPCE